MRLSQEVKFDHRKRQPEERVTLERICSVVTYINCSCRGLSWSPTPSLDASQLAVTLAPGDEGWKQASGWAPGKVKIILAKLIHGSDFFPSSWTLSIVLWYARCAVPWSYIFYPLFLILKTTKAIDAWEWWHFSQVRCVRLRKLRTHWSLFGLKETWDKWLTEVPI